MVAGVDSTIASVRSLVVQLVGSDRESDRPAAERNKILLDECHALELRLDRRKFLHSTAAIRKKNELSAFFADEFFSSLRRKLIETTIDTRARVPVVNIEIHRNGLGCGAHFFPQMRGVFFRASLSALELWGLVLAFGAERVGERAGLPGWLQDYRPGARRVTLLMC